MKCNGSSGLIMCFVFLGAFAFAVPEYEPVTLVLPKGDVKAGRAAFEELDCHACHKVPGDPQFTTPRFADRGPDLGPEQGKYTAGRVGTAIVAPSHIVLYQYAKPGEGQKSPMPDYSRGMTLRQLTDILAYIDSLDAKKK